MLGCLEGKILGGFECITVDDVSVEDVWRVLCEDSASLMIDVRSKAEWAYVGIVDLSDIGKAPVLIEWQSFPGKCLNGRFVQDLCSELDVAGADRQTHLFFICRSGVRSLVAAQAVAALGYETCHNVACGFEGPLDDKRHRGTVSGWKAAGLPWVQG